MTDGRKGNAADRRDSPREELEPIEIRGFTSLDHMTLIARLGYIVDASKTGFLLHIDREELVPRQFRNTLSLQEIEGDKIILMIEPLNLEVGGRIARTKRLTRHLYEIAIDFSDDAPEYWRECLIDMLPRAEDYE